MAKWFLEHTTRFFRMVDKYGTMFASDLSKMNTCGGLPAKCTNHAPSWIVSVANVKLGLQHSLYNSSMVYKMLDFRGN